MSNNVRFSRITSRDSFYKDAIKGEIAYDVDSNDCYFFNGNTWKKLLLDGYESVIGDKQRKHSTTCPRCGASCSPYQEKCDYCDSYFEF